MTHIFDVGQRAQSNQRDAVVAVRVFVPFLEYKKTAPLLRCGTHTCFRKDGAFDSGLFTEQTNARHDAVCKNCQRLPFRQIEFTYLWCHRRTQINQRDIVVAFRVFEFSARHRVALAFGPLYMHTVRLHSTGHMVWGKSHKSTGPVIRCYHSWFKILQ